MKWLIAVGAVVIICVVFGVIVQQRKGKGANKVDFKDTNDMMRWLAEEAVATARDDCSVQLDYTTGSIEKVEQVLARLHEEYSAGRLSQGYRGMAMAFGAYIGEAIRRSDPSATWGVDHPAAGPKSYPLRWRDGDIFPMGWCYKRIVDGADDNVWVKYLVIREERDGTPATAPAVPPGQ